MKLTIIGGGSVRTPRLIPSLIKRSNQLTLDELWLMDIDADKLELMGGLCQTMAEQAGATFRVHLTTDPKEAIKDADHIVTTIRPGFEQGRVLDERIAFKHGVLGQETTGAGGFAMAMRSLPAILEYCQLAQAIAAPDVWIYNFTNPAGLVAQGLHDAGIRNIVGICDSANGAQHAVSRYLGVPMKRVYHEVYGLNHLSWTNSVRVDPDPDGSGGEEVLPALLTDEKFIKSTHMAMFHPIVRQLQGTWLNEYLHYYYHRDEALQTLLSKPETRGEEVVRFTHELLAALKAINPHVHPDQALAVYHEVMGKRSASYMAHARHGAARPKMEIVGDDDEGYAGVALGCVQAIQNNALHYTGLNVPNRGAIDGFADDDIVEVSCWVDASGIRPMHVGAMPPSQLILAQTIKHYEHLASRAIRNRDKLIAVEALANHPLVGSYPLAIALVDDFVEAHQAYLGGTWH